VHLRGNGLPGKPELWELRRDGRTLMVCQRTKSGWFWYGCGKNNFPTCTELPTAKAEAKAYLLKHHPDK